jgi:molybdenum cofactor cytidylyltransferase
VTVIAAVVLAAGLSRRMGQPKMVLPWGNTTVIGRVVQTLIDAGLSQILVVTGGARNRVEDALRDLPVRTVNNPRYEQDHMAFSLQVGLSNLPKEVDAALIVLGDQPQVETCVVKTILETYTEAPAPLIVPSYRMRRGHPWLIERSLWKAVWALKPPQTLRDFMNAHAGQIRYLEFETASVLSDLDTPSDYERQRPVL